jgi:hypothetical protein
MEPEILKFRTWWLERKSGVSGEPESSGLGGGGGGGGAAAGFSGIGINAGSNDSPLMRKDVEVWFDTRRDTIMLKVVDEGIKGGTIERSQRLGSEDYDSLMNTGYNNNQATSSNAVVYTLDNPQAYTKHDFHPSATLTIGGRKTTLRQASLGTMNWYEKEHTRLTGVLGRLRRENLKYEGGGGLSGDMNSRGSSRGNQQESSLASLSNSKKDDVESGLKAKSLRHLIEKCEVEGTKLWGVRPGILGRILSGGGR